MKVVITEGAKKGLLEIFAYHLDYSEDYAVNFQFKIDEYIVENLTEFPKLGHVYNQEKMLYRLIYDARYNIYYQIKGKTVFILYVLDGQTQFNSDLLESETKLP